MTLNISYTWKCDVCGTENTSSHGAIAMHNHVVSLDMLPAGWSLVDTGPGCSTRMVCHRHNIEIDRLVGGTGTII